MSIRSCLIPLATWMTLAACAAGRAQPQPAVSVDGADGSTAQAPLVGGDRDAHGCIGSAGYSWCARERACVRPWELASQKGFANEAAAFTKYCDGAQRGE